MIQSQRRHSGAGSDTECSGMQIRSNSLFLDLAVINEQVFARAWCQVVAGGRRAEPWLGRTSRVLLGEDLQGFVILTTGRDVPQQLGFPSMSCS